MRCKLNKIEISVVIIWTGLAAAMVLVDV